MTRDEFLARYEAIYEASPWVAEGAWAAGAREGDALAAAMRKAVDDAPHARKLALIRAHPELAGRAAIAGDMAEASKKEQSGAGLDRCTPEEFAEFQRLNGAYNARFGFPFIVAVKGHDRAGILAEFRRRLDNAPEVEFDTAIEQIHRIAGFRLAALSPLP
jgi:2-oxo-4-hydroxy-4-carboxy-5-ureidoimidazoline decarboxylase